MTQALHFPTNFVWGAAVSSHQVEGNNTNNQWWEFEQQPGAIWHGDKSELACDWWRSAERDFDLMQQFGVRALRLSVEWSRIEPQPGEFDHRALDRYREMLSALHARGIAPTVCFHHFTNPLWLQARGAWEQGECAERFASYVRVACGALHDLCDTWLTINEPIVYVQQSYNIGIWPPRKRNMVLAMAVYRNLLFGHAAAYHTIHEIQPDARVGNATATRAFRGERPGNALDRWAAGFYRYMSDGLWLGALADGHLRPPLGVGGYHAQIKNTFDFIGVNYYSRDLVRFTPNPLKLFGERKFPANVDLSDSGRGGPYSWYAPDGLYDSLLAMAKLGKPIYVTENGLPDKDDDQRPRWLLGHLHAVQRAIVAGADVRGYYHWTFADNFEWSEGWGLRFGLVEVDPTTQERRPRPSAYLYRSLAEANAISPDLVRQYAPELLPTLFA